MTARTQLLWFGAALVASAVYYGFYIDCGFNFADDGNYAQIAYELLLGRNPHDIAFNYGLLWFKLGEGLFRLFGVHFILVKLLFFACITATNLLVFYCLARATGRLWIAAVLTAVTLLVPPFPATAFYGVCILANAAAQIRFAARFRPVDAGLAAAVLGLSFQIRPDFGFVFIVPLLALLLMASRTTKASTLIAATVAGFIAGSLPFIICAAIGGYMWTLAQPYLEYPKLLAEFLLHGFRSFVQGVPQPGAIATLQRPQLGESPVAVLVDLPPLALFCFAVFIVATVRKRWHAGEFRRIGEALVAFAAGIAAFPHYFFFRPDLAHIANFMPGFVVMAGVFFAQFRADIVNAPVPSTERALSGFTTAVLALQIGLYLVIGIRSGETGSIALMHGRHVRFTTDNGVDVRVTQGEKDQLEIFKTAIVENSKPGDAIVCLPYCPGLAFMTGRRMFFANFYVDETFLVRKPEWLPSAIAATTRTPPPMAIIEDVAFNGTEQSRFPNWAASYMSVLDSLTVGRFAAPGAMVYVLRSPPPS